MKAFAVYAVCCACCVALVPAARAQQQPIVVVFDIEDKGWGLDTAVLSNLTDLLMVNLTRGGYRTVPRSQVQQRIRDEQSSSYRACYDEGCQIELGRELAAQKSLATQVFKIAGECQVTATLFDLKTAVAEQAAFAESACDERSLLKAIREISQNLCSQGHPTSAHPATTGAAAEVTAGTGPAAGAAEKTPEPLPPTEPPPAVQMGTLAIRGEPQDATIWIDGERVGQSPWQGELAPGVHIVKVFKPGFIGTKKETPVQAGEAHDVSFTLKKFAIGSLVVETQPPGATVYLNGKDAGQTPLHRDVMPRSFAVTVELAGHKTIKRTAEVEPGGRTEIRIALSQKSPMGAVEQWGHIAFWTGLGLVAFGGVASWQTAVARDNYVAGDRSAADRHSAWKGTAIAGFVAGGAAITTGLLLWLLSPGETEDLEQQHLSLVPSPDGFCLGWVGRW